MGGWIRRGWIWRFCGASIFSPEVPNAHFNVHVGTSGRKIGAPQKTPNPTTTDAIPPSQPSDLLNGTLEFTEF